MQRLLSVLFMWFALSIAHVNAKVYSGNCGDSGSNVTWSLDTDSGVLTISGTGGMKNYYGSSSPWCSPWCNDRNHIKTVEISEGVTSIGAYAFYDCSSLSSIVIPESVTGIGGEAFANCYSLNSVHVKDIASWCKIFFVDLYSNPFHYAKHLYVDGVKIRDLIIPEGVTSIGAYAFYDCSSLSSIVIPEGVTSIENYAFCNCSSLSSIVIPEGVTSIGAYAFYVCSSLSSIVIPEGVTSIGGGAFSRCSSLSSIVIPEGVTSIGINAFSGCSSLSSIVIPEGVTSIGRGAFSGCSSLSSIVIPEGVTSVGDRAFSGCSSLSSIVIPEGVTSIDGAFYGCSSLSSIVIPEGVTSIGDRAFYGCSSLSSIVIPEGVTSIGDGAFYGCSSLSSIVIPEGVTSIGDCAFWHCSSLSSIVIPEGVTSIEDYAFYNCSSLSSIVIPEGVTSIGDYAFCDCSSLTDITLPDSVISIGGCAFYETNWWNNHPDGLIYMNCYLLGYKGDIPADDIAIKESTKVIGEGAFEYCGLTSITIPNSVTSIGDRAFYECYSLDTVKVGFYTPLPIFPNTFSNQDRTTLYVPAGSEMLFQSADVWCDFKEIVPYNNEDTQSMIRVNLPNNDGMFRGSILELFDTETKETKRLFVSNQSLYSFGGIEKGRTYNLYLKSHLDDILGCIENLFVEESDVIVNFDSLKLLQTVSLSILLPHGLNVTEETTISWYDKNKTYISQGCSLAGLLEGTRIGCSIKLPKVLAEQYQQPSDTVYEVKASDNHIVCTLKPYGRVKVFGRILAQTTHQTLSGVTIDIEQTLDNGIKKTITVVSDANGMFTAEVYDASSCILVSNPQYISKTFTHQGFDRDTELGDIELEPIGGTVIIVNFTYTESVANEQNAETEDWYYDNKNVIYTIYNQSTGMPVNDFTVQNSGIVLQEKVGENDVLLITAKSKTQRFKDITVEGMNNALGQIKVKIPVVEWGTLKASCLENHGKETVGLLYDCEGLLVRKEKYDADTLTIKNIPDGEYTLVSMTHNEFFNSLPNLTEYGNAGMVENTDYVKSLVSIASGKITSVQINHMPVFDESKFYYTTEGTGMVANKPSVTVGEYVVIKTKVDFKEEYANGITGLKLIVHLPDSCELYPNTVVVNGKLANYTADGNRVEIELNEVASDIRFCAIPQTAGVKKPSGFVQFDINGNNVIQPIGAAHFTCKALELSVPELTNDSCVTVRGIALNRKMDIYIYDNTVLVGQTTSQVNGEWQADIELYKPYTHTFHRIYAVAADADGYEYSTETKVVEYCRNISVLQYITMLYNGKEIVFDYQQGTSNEKTYSYVPGVADFTFTAKFSTKDSESTFTAKFSTKDSESIKNPVFKVLASDGSTRTIPATYNANQNIWVGTSKYPNSNRIPVNVIVKYDNNDQVSPIFDSEMDADFKQMTQTVFNEIDSAYMNAPIEIIEEKGNCLYFSIITSGYNTKEYYKFYILDYEEVLQEYKDKDVVIVQNDTTDLCCIHESINDNYHLVVWDNIAKNAYKLEHSGQRPMVEVQNSRILPFLIGAVGSVAMSAGEYHIYMQEIDSWYKTVDFEKEKHRMHYEKMREFLYATCEDGSLKIKDETKFALCTDLANQWNHSSKKYLDEFTTVIDEDKKSLQQRCTLKGLVGVATGAAFSMVGALVNIISIPFSKGASILAQNIESMAPTLLQESASQIVSNKLGNDIDNIDEVLKKNGVKRCISQWYMINSRKNTDAYIELLQTIKSSYSSCEKEEDDEQEENKEKDKDNFDEENDYRVPDLTPAIDPSGYVYESVPSNRLQGVTTTIFYQETSEDMYGNLTNKAVLWNAEEFSQKNPLTTDEEGKYQWDVPQGLWQVKFEKEGYETTYSDWLPVPPPQLEVNIAMTQNTQPVVKSAHAYADAVEIEFDKYMLPASLNAQIIKVAQNGENVSGKIELLDEELSNVANTTYVSKIRFVPNTSFTVEEIELTIKGDVKSYAGIYMAEDYSDMLKVEYRINTIQTDTLVNIYCDSIKTLMVSVIPAQAAIGKTLRVHSTSPQIANITNDSYTFNEEGKAFVQLIGVLPGNTSLNYTIEDYGISTQTGVKVKMHTESFCDIPFASVKSGSKIEKGSTIRLYCNTEGAIIYYTLDGSCPCNDTSARKIYDGHPIIIDKDIVIKAMAVAPNLYESGVIELEYSIKEIYTITYIIDGVEYKKVKVEYGANVTAEDAPVKNGFIFSGWSEIPETMPAKDIVVTGSFIADCIEIIDSDTFVNVYTLQGVMVKRQIPVEDLEKELPTGIYIVNGKKMVVK